MGSAAVIPVPLLAPRAEQFDLVAAEGACALHHPVAPVPFDPAWYQVSGITSNADLFTAGATITIAAAGDVRD